MSFLKIYKQYLKFLFKNTLGNYEIKLKPRAKRLPKIYRLALKRQGINKKFFTTSASLYLPVILAILLFIFIKPSHAQFLDYDTRLASYAVNNDFEVGTVTNEDNINQIYFEYDGKRNVITDTNYTNGSPYSSHEYIVWMGLIDGYWQIFRHHIPTKTTIQLTHSANNANPKVNTNGDVVWESLVYSIDGSSTWQIFLYDGKSSKQISENSLLSQNADIDGDYVVYSTKGINNVWTSYAYSIEAQSTKEIAVGQDSRYPHLDGKNIYLSSDSKNQKRFNLNTDDLFLLDLKSLTTKDQTATQDSMLQEINSLINDAEALKAQNQAILDSTQ
jgi:hypothetical protein